MPIHELRAPCSQVDFAQMIGVDPSRVSQLIAEGVLPQQATALEWIRTYCGRLRFVAERRGFTEGGLDLVKERALLARAQRVAQEIKNARSRREFAPTGLLESMLSAISEHVVQHMKSAANALDQECPDLPVAAKQTINQILGSACAEWKRSTSSLDFTSADLAADADDIEAPEPLALEPGAGEGPTQASSLP